MFDKKSKALDYLIRLHFHFVTQKSNSHWKAICPAHPGHDLSSLSIVFDEGKLILECDFGCTFESIRKAAKLNTRYKIEESKEAEASSFNAPNNKTITKKIKKFRSTNSKSAEILHLPTYDGRVAILDKANAELLPSKYREKLSIGLFINGSYILF